MVTDNEIRVVLPLWGWNPDKASHHDGTTSNEQSTAGSESEKRPGKRKDSR